MRVPTSKVEALSVDITTTSARGVFITQQRKSRLREKWVQFDKVEDGKKWGRGKGLGLMGQREWGIRKRTKNMS